MGFNRDSFDIYANIISELREFLTSKVLFYISHDKVRQSYIYIYPHYLEYILYSFSCKIRQPTCSGELCSFIDYV